MTAHLSTYRESDDGYSAVVTRLNERWRVIACRDGIQWIIQQGKKTGHGTRWRGRKYLTTRKTLIRSCARFIGEIPANSEAKLAALPESIGRASHG